MVTLKDYILAMETCRQYEENLTGDVCRCSYCKLKFKYDKTTLIENYCGGGSYKYETVCPYCNKRTVAMTY